MLLISKKEFVIAILFIFFAHNTNAQIKLGTSYGGNYDFDKWTPDRYTSNAITNLILIYENDTRLKPFLSIGFAKIPLNYSDVILRNQGNFKTAVLNNSMGIELGIESIIKNYSSVDFSARFGFGIIFFSNPLVFLEDSHEGFGYASAYSARSETKFPFLDFSFKIDKTISDNWTINFILGTEYYPENSSLRVNTKISETAIEVNSSFTKVRPYAKIGVAYLFKNDF